MIIFSSLGIVALTAFLRSTGWSWFFALAVAALVQCATAYASTGRGNYMRILIGVIVLSAFPYYLLPAFGIQSPKLVSMAITISCIMSSLALFSATLGGLALARQNGRALPPVGNSWGRHSHAYQASQGRKQ